MQLRNLLFLTTAGLVPVALAQPRPVNLVANNGAGYLGVMTQDINSDRAKALKLPEEAGVEITFLVPNTPAATAGIKVGDVIMEYNGERVEGKDQFSRVVRETPAGREVKLLVYREGAPQTVVAKMGSRPPIAAVGTVIPGIPLPPSNTGAVPDVGFSRMTWGSPSLGTEVESLNAQLADYFGVKDGVLVRSVTSGSAAEKAGLKAGDVITRVEDAHVATPADLSARLRAVRGQSVALAVMRDHKELSLTVSLDPTRPF